MRKKTGIIMPKIVDHEKYKEELLMKGFNLFGEKGYTDVTMREIALELNVSTGLLYHYFPTKQNILEEMLKMMSRFEINKASSLLKKSSSLEKRLSILIKFFKDREKIFTNFFLLTIDYHRHCNSEENKQFMEKFEKNVTIAVRDNLEIDMDLARHCFIFFSGLYYLRLVFGKKIDYDSLTSSFKDIILKYLDSNKKQ